MSEIIKVFKNVNTQTHVGAATSLTLASTTASQQAVIKDVTCPGVRKADLDLDGFTLMSATGYGRRQGPQCYRQLDHGAKLHVIYQVPRSGCSLDCKDS